jgi:hypothetical protein
MKIAKLLAVLSVVGLMGNVALAQGGGGGGRGMNGLMGTVVKVDGTNLVVKQMARGQTEAKEVTVATDDKTKVTLDGKEAKLADLKEGLRVMVSPAEGTATTIAAMTPSIRGQITKVDGAKITVKVQGRGPNAEATESVVTTDDKTVVTLDDKEAKVADLKADIYVTVTPDKGTATKIVATTKAPAGRGGRGGAGGAGGAAPAN